MRADSLEVSTADRMNPYGANNQPHAGYGYVQRLDQQACSEKALVDYAREQAEQAFDRDELVELTDETLVRLIKHGTPIAAGHYLAALYQAWLADATDRRLA